MTRRFLITSLPHSGTLWTSVQLSKYSLCKHDGAFNYKQPQATVLKDIQEDIDKEWGCNFGVCSPELVPFAGHIQRLVRRCMLKRCLLEPCALRAGLDAARASG